MKGYDYLNDERIKLWKKVDDLEKQLLSKTSDSEVEARQHAEAALKHLQEIQHSLAAIKGINGEAENYFNSVTKIATDINEIAKQVQVDTESVSSLNTSAATERGEISKMLVEVKSDFAEMKPIFSNNVAMVARLDEFEKQCEKAKELSSKVETLHKTIATKKTEIDGTYYEIYGYSEKDEKTGEETLVKGLKDELDESYRQLKANFEAHQNTARGVFGELSGAMKTFEDNKKNELKELIDKWSLDYINVKNRIETLLPNALTAGLSHAYSDKKKQEEDESRSHKSSFNRAILGMMVVSLIPIAVSIKFLITGLSLDEVVLRLPRLVSAILPIYVPVMWIAYSSNRKSNLSKRLIEEYSHKEALSKTYEGLSTQIASLGENETSNELRVKLLYNILEVSSENPGKLISDYNKSDHPLMDALDKSVKLTNSVEKLARLPGFAKLAGTLAGKAEKIVKAESKKAEKGLEATDPA